MSLDPNPKAQSSGDGGVENVAEPKMGCSDDVGCRNGDTTMASIGG